MEYVKRLLLVLHWLALTGTAAAGVWAIAGIGAWLMYSQEIYAMLSQSESDYWAITIFPLLVGLGWVLLTAALRFIIEGKVRLFPWQRA